MAENEVMLVGVIDGSVRPGSDIQRARISLQSCDRVVEIQDAGESRALFRSLAPTDWIVALRSNEWLADDAIATFRQTVHSSVGVDAYCMGVANHIGEKEIRSPELILETEPRFIRSSVIMFSDRAGGFGWSVLDKIKPVDLPSHRIHTCLACNVREFAERVLPRWPFPTGIKPSEVMEQFFNTLGTVGHPENQRDGLSVQVSILTAWAYMQRCLVDGLFDQVPEILTALQLVPTGNRSGVADIESITRICRENGALAIEHARHHLDRANDRIGELEAALQAAQRQISWYERTPIGWIVRFFRKITRR